MKPIFPLILLLPMISLAQPAAAQSSTVPLFDSSGTSLIGGDPNPYPYAASIAPTTGQQTFYISLGTGSQSGSPWGGGNQVTALNLALWEYSANASAVPVTVGLYTGTDTSSGITGLTGLSGASAPFSQNINNTIGGTYTNSATVFTFSLSGGAQLTDPIPANTDLIIGITVTAGNPLDLAVGAPLGGSPSPTYTFSNAFSGSTGLSGFTYLYAGADGDTSSLVQTNTNLLPFVDLTASITPLPELPPVTYLLLSLPLVLGVLMVRRRARA
jgi:hypothetical protein